MENVSKNSTNDKVLSQMKSENLHISPDDILCSLQPLIAEYFDGDCKCSGDSITYTAANGQKFYIVAAEIKYAEVK